MALTLASTARPYFHTLKFAWRSARGMFGRYPRNCTVCGHDGRFLGYGYPFVCDILCPTCSSLERHRLLAIADEKQNFFAGRDVLHFAPEACMRTYLAKRGLKSYRTADLFAANVDLKLNIEAIDLPDAVADVVLCLHVLEHVDDSKALGELHRILRPGGLLIAMFPMVEGWSRSFEDPKRTSPEDRLLFFGQHDHVRFFGADARERLARPGFLVEEVTAEEPDVSRHGLMRGEKIFLCRKPASGG
ncbi:MAG: class I SAM-dependent methyltransferase [Aestuariivirga sp.]